MGAFSGVEPLVGEIVGLRTFRVDDSGLLLPLYSTGTWYDGVNTACCTPPTGDRRGVHTVPDPACECGFYAYGTVEAADRARQSRYVRAVVMCWGGVVAGTQGVRAQHARIVALWLHPDAPSSLRSRVMSRYPSARFYADADVMLAAHPLSVLPCYQPPQRRRVVRRGLESLAVVLLLVLGVLPYETLTGTHGLFEFWLVSTAASGVLALWLGLGAHTVGHRAAALVVIGVCAWLAAPAFGLWGWVLRIPLLRGLAIAVGGVLVGLVPHHFPVLATPRERVDRSIRA